MKTLKFFSLILLVYSHGGCQKDPGCTDPVADNYDYSAEDNDGSCIYSGSVVFWMNSSFNQVDVTVNGTTKAITMYYPSSIPTCGSSGCATFELETGSYNYEAHEQGVFGYDWSGSFTITKNGCNSIFLY